MTHSRIWSACTYAYTQYVVTASSKTEVVPKLWKMMATWQTTGFLMNVDTCHLAIHRLPFITTSLVVVQLTGWATSRYFPRLGNHSWFACFELSWCPESAIWQLWKWIKSSIDWGRPLTLEHSEASTVQPNGLLQHRSHHCWEPKLFKFTERLLGTSCLEFFQNTTHKVWFLIFPSRQKKSWSGKQDLPAPPKNEYFHHGLWTASKRTHAKHAATIGIPPPHFPTTSLYSCQYS